VTDRDPVLRRIEQNAVIVCGAMTMLALILTRGRVIAGVGVVAGGALAAISYRGIKGGVDALVALADGRKDAWKTAAIGLVKFFTRYGILAAVAYVILARARMPPVPVVVGASSLVIAVMVEAARGVTARHGGDSAPW